ncbi:SDR family NAD(P)-dependent oxidoreductase [Devosia lucknowensis]|uniref:SDR family NAD(P)-dependent oxidoreductase n=1 Tax=Devosia lucknowensis TaxID=1096929 RepID=UPI0026A0B5C8
MARMLLAEGARVALVDRDALRLDQLCGELGRNAFAVVTNLKDPWSAEALVRAILAHAEEIDIIHANADSHAWRPDR